MAGAGHMGIKNAKQIIEQVVETASRWQKYASESGVNPLHADQINKNLRLLRI
jgi:N-glycosylase/DNA lyase